MAILHDRSGLKARIHAALPQTQCTRCGYPDCESYATAVAHEGVAINRCAPGGEEGIARLAQLTGQPRAPMDEAFGRPQERTVAFVDENWCIGCTLCIKACPVDAIIGVNRAMHTVIEDICTGCELCVPVCPVDCIEIEVATPGQTGWAAWSQTQADAALERYQKQKLRVRPPLPTQAVKNTPSSDAMPETGVAAGTEVDAQAQAQAKKQRFVQAALSKARQRDGSSR